MILALRWSGLAERLSAVFLHRPRGSFRFASRANLPRCKGQLVARFTIYCNVNRCSAARTTGKAAKHLITGHSSQTLGVAAVVEQRNSSSTRRYEVLLLSQLKRFLVGGRISASNTRNRLILGLGAATRNVPSTASSNAFD